MAHVDDDHIPQAPRLSFSALQHFRYQAPFCSLSVPEKRLRIHCPDSQKSHTQGLATLSAVSATRYLGNLSQLPTLMGFALQSFPPLSWSNPPLEELSPLSRLPTKPSQTSYRRLSDLLPQKKPCPSTSLAEGLVRPGTFALLGFPTS
jgi:hypothetical protein